MGVFPVTLLNRILFSQTYFVIRPFLIIYSLLNVVRRTCCCVLVLFMVNGRVPQTGGCCSG